MKFGSQIKEGLYAEWEKYYIDYSGLKKFLKRRQAAHESKNESNIWDDADEAEFIKKLQDELTKVSRFQEEKVAELHGQIALYSEEVQELVSLQQQQKSGKQRLNTGGSSTPTGAAAGSSGQVAKLGDDEENISRARQYYDDDDDDDEDDDDLSTEAEETERRFTELEEDLEVLIADVYDLGRFTHLNYTGFIKIVKVSIHTLLLASWVLFS